MNIVLGITGGIAAYKAPDLVRRLKERGADVQIVMTASAAEFVTDTALQFMERRAEYPGVLAQLEAVREFPEP